MSSNSIFSILLYITSHLIYYVQSDIDNSAFIIWGPGLKSDFNVPVRYFYIQAVDTNGENFTESLGDRFNVELVTNNRVYFMVSNLNNGQYVIRFRLHEKKEELRFTVKYDGKDIQGSPIIIKGTMYTENCNCPEPDMAAFKKALNCPIPTSNEKLGKFRTGIDMDHISKRFYKVFTNIHSQSLTHYVIKDNKIYMKTHGEHVGFHMFSDNILISLAKKVKLPDMEFFMNLGDWPLIIPRIKEVLPLFSWCGSSESHDIILPTYDLTESVLEMMSRVSMDLFSIAGSGLSKWSDKNDTVFWRGRDSTQERLDLIKISRRYPSIIDARLTNMFFFKHDPSEHGELVKHIPFNDFFKYKYQLNMDGTVAAYRLPYLMAGNSLILKQDSPYWEHFYKDLIPYKHYVPFKRDLSDLLEKIKWSKDHQREAQKIVSNAQEFVREHLTPSRIICSHLDVFNEYASMITSPIVIREGMKEVKIENTEYCSCEKAKDEL